MSKIFNDLDQQEIAPFQHSNADSDIPKNNSKLFSIHRFHSEKIAYVSFFVAVSIVTNTLLTVNIGTDLAITFNYTISFIIGSILGPFLGFFVGFFGDLLGFIIKPSGSYLLPAGISSGLMVTIFAFSTTFKPIQKIVGNFSNKSLNIFIKNLICVTPVIVAMLIVIIVCTFLINSTTFFITFKLFEKYTLFQYYAARAIKQLPIAAINLVFIVALKLFYEKIFKYFKTKLKK